MKNLSILNIENHGSFLANGTKTILTMFLSL